MAISLYDVSVANYLQTLGAAGHFLERGASHCREHGISLDEIVDARIHPDMLPFHFQIHSIVHHALGTIQAIEQGTFSPSRGQRVDYAELQAKVGQALETLKKVAPEQINPRESAEVVFQSGEHKARFTAADFVLSFSLPNLYFHATTAYDILRGRGVPLGKRDFMGRLRIQR